MQVVSQLSPSQLYLNCIKGNITDRLRVLVEKQIAVHPCPNVPFLLTVRPASVRLAHWSFYSRCCLRYFFGFFLQSFLWFAVRRQVLRQSYDIDTSKRKQSLEKIKAKRQKHGSIPSHPKPPYLSVYLTPLSLCVFLSQSFSTSPSNIASATSPYGSSGFGFGLCSCLSLQP